MPKRQHWPPDTRDTSREAETQTVWPPISPDRKRTRWEHTEITDHQPHGSSSLCEEGTSRQDQSCSQAENNNNDDNKTITTAAQLTYCMPGTRLNTFLTLTSLNLLTTAFTRKRYYCPPPAVYTQVKLRSREDNSLAQGHTANK